MKLFFSGGTSAMSVVIALEELGLPCEYVEVSFKNKVNVDQLESYNPAGLVPTLILDNGKVLTQNAAVLEYLSDQKPSVGLLAAPATAERAQTMSWLLTSVAELAQTFRQGFRAHEVTDDEKEQGKIEGYAKTRIEEFLGYLNTALKGKSYIMGETFTIADCHLFVTVGFADGLEINLDQFPEVSGYYARMENRTAVKRALAREA